MQRALLVGIFVACALGLGVFSGCNKRSMTPAEQAAAHVRHARWDEAIALCDEILAKSPKDVEILATRGVAYTATEQWDKAIADYTTIIECQPDDPDAYYRRAVTYDLMGEKQQALEDRLSAHRRNPMAAMMASAPSAEVAPATIPAEFADADPAVTLPSSLAPHDTYESQREEADAMALKVREHLEAFDEELEGSSSLTLPGSIRFTEMLRTQSKAIASALGGLSEEEGGEGDADGEAPARGVDDMDPVAAEVQAPPAPRWEMVTPANLGSPAYATGQYKNIGSAPAYPVQTGISSSLASSLGSGSPAGSAVPGAAVPGVATAYPTAGVSTSMNAPSSIPYTASAHASTVGIGMGGFGPATSPMGTAMPVDATSGQFHPSPIYASPPTDLDASAPSAAANASPRTPAAGRAISRTSAVPTLLPESYLPNPAGQFGRPILPSQLGQGPAAGTGSFLAHPEWSEEISAGLPTRLGAGEGYGSGQVTGFPRGDR